MLCRWAKDVALVSVKLAIILCISRIILILGPFTYYNMQIARAMPELIGAVLLLGAVGTAWLQMLYRRH